MTLKFLDPYCEQLAAGRGRSSGAWSATGSTKKNRNQDEEIASCETGIGMEIF